MNLSDLQTKEIISINSGKRMGMIVDVIVNTDGTIKSLMLEERKLGKKFMSSSKEENEVFWKQIIKIGDDIILVDSEKK